MQINPNEVSDIVEIGVLNGSPVKMLRLKGGFNVACGSASMGAAPSALAAGSHVAIVRYKIEQQFPNFQPSLMKSEGMDDGAIVEQHSHYLSQELRKSNHGIYSVQTGSNIDFIITKDTQTIHTVNSQLENENIEIKKLSIPKEFSHAMAGAATEKARSCGAEKIKLG